MAGKQSDVRIGPSFEDLERAAGVPGADCATRLRWGWALYAAGRFGEAAGVAAECCDASSGDPETAYLLGMALKAAGDKSGAVAAFKVAAESARGIGDEVRGAMLRRLAVGQVNWLSRGDWDLEPETWVRT
jgi:hypothetical protein